MIETLQSHQSAAAATRLEREQLLNDSRQSASEVDIEAQRARLEHAHLNEQLQGQLARVQEQERNATTITARSKFIEEESARLRVEFSELDTQINLQASSLSEAEQSHRNALTSDTEIEQALETARQQLYEATGLLERWRHLNRQFEDSRDRSSTRLTGLLAEQERTEAQSLATAERQSTLTEKVREREAREAEIAGELSESNESLTGLRERRAILASDHTLAREELSSVEHRLKSLVELDDRHAYFSEPVQKLLNRAAAGEFRALGTLADFVHPSSANEAMIEAVLQDELEYVLVPGYEDALRGIEMLAGEGGGRGTFIVCWTARGRPQHSPYRQRVSSSEQRRCPAAATWNLRPEFSASFERAFPSLPEPACTTPQQKRSRQFRRIQRSA